MSKLLSFYKNMKAPVKAAFWFTISNILQKGISFISTPIFTRLMTTDQYGMYSVYQSWHSIIIIFATLNLYAGVYNNGMTNYPDDRPRYTAALQGLSTTLTLILLGVYLCAPAFFNRLMGLPTLLVLAMFAEILVIPGYNFWSAGQRYDYAYKKQIAVAVAITLLVPIAGVICVMNTEYKTEARVLSMVFVHICIAGALYLYNFCKGKAFFDKKYWKYALAFNIPLIPHYLSQTVLNQADRIMIGNMIGKSEAAIYSVAYTVSMMMTIFTNAINNSFVPYTYKSMKKGDIEGVRRNSNFLVIVVFAACILAMAFGPEIIRIVASPQYYEARWIIPPVAASLFFLFLFPLYCNIEFFYEETKCIMLASCLAALVNVGLNYVAISMFGYIAAAYTTLICYILLAVTHYYVHRWVLQKHDHTEPVYNTKFFILLSVVLIAVMIFMTMFYDIPLVRYSIILGIAVAIVLNRRTIVKRLKDVMK